MGVVREDLVKMGFDIDFAELTRLTSALDDIKKTLTGGIGDNAFDEMVKESKKASKGLDGIKDSINGIKPDGLEDTVKGLKDTDEEAEDAYKELKKIGDAKFNKTITGLKKLTSTLGTVGIQAGKLLAKGIAVGVAGAGALVAKSIMNYADYEQLVGGVDTLFKDSSGTVQKYADNAYKTAGLSANAYMETVTSFSASLIQSLGGNTGKAAEYADMAITDMSDNANKMGSDMSSIQDAYQGFAKQNYTMLDNLKLGYGGTKEEMTRLLKDAKAISGIEYDISSYADVVAAIHVIQEDLGIAGTTAKEASETISGSFASMKAAWSNTLTSLILGGDDFDRCVDNLVDSVKTFGKNIMPALVKGLEGLGALIEEMAPIIEKELPTIIDTLLPPLIKAATALLKGLIIALPDIIKTLIDEIPSVLQQVWEGISEAFGDLPGIGKIESFFKTLHDFFTDNADIIKKCVPALIGLVVAFKLFNKIKGLTGLFGGGGSGAGGGFFSGMASMKPTVVLKGMFNLAIIVGGLAILAAALMAVAPYMAQLSDLRSIGEVLIVVTAIGILGTALSKMAGGVGNIPVAKVAKGLANIAIVMVGLGALTALFMWLAPYVAELADTKTIIKLLAIITAVGLVGAALTGIAGLVGMIPIPVVLFGLAGIAIALAGFTLIVAAFAALSKIPGFNDFIESGGATLAKLFNVLGQVIGSVIGGIGEGISASLPAIGANLAAFAESVKPMFDMIGEVDAEGLKGFAGGLAALIAVIAGEELVSFITGGIDYAKLGTDLTDFATNVAGFFNTVSTFDEGSFAKATAMFNCLANIDSLPKEGGVVGWFMGEVDYTKMANGLNDLAGAVGFFTAVEGISDAAFSNATGLFECLSDISLLPNSGGVAQWFTGEVDYSGLAAGLNALAGTTSFFSTVAGIPESSFASATALFSCLSAIGELPHSGGVFQWFTGEVDYAGIATGMDQLAGTTGFFSTVAGISEAGLSNATALFTCLSAIGGLPHSGGIFQWFTGEVDYADIAAGMDQLAGTTGFFATVEGISPTAFTNATAMFTCLSGIGSLPNSGGVVSWFVGDVDYAGIATGLNQLAGTTTFFSAVEGITEAAFTNATALFHCLSGIGELPNSGGVVSWFVGDVDYAGIATGLNQLATATTFFTAVEGISETAFTNATTLFNTLSGVGALPNSGGVAQWFTGTIDYAGLATGLQQLTSPEMMAAYTAIGNIPETAFSGITTLFTTLAGVSAMPKEGGIFQWFTGSSSEGLNSVASQLPGIATHIATFFANLGGITDFTTISNLFNTLSSIKIDTDVADGTGLFGAGASQLESIGQGLSDFATNARPFFLMIDGLKTENLSSFFDFMSNVGGLPEKLSGVNASLGTTLKNITDTVSTKLAELKTDVETGLTDIVTAITSQETAFYNSGSAIMQGVNDGMLSQLPTLISTAQSMATAVQNAFDVEMKINSPSKVMEDKGVDTAMGQVVGMRKTIPTVEMAARDIGRASIPYSRTYSPDTDSGISYSRGSTSEYTTVSPSFNLTISGTQDDRATARKVKQWVAEAIQEAFESLDRKTPVTREA